MLAGASEAVLQRREDNNLVIDSDFGEPQQTLGEQH